MANTTAQIIRTTVALCEGLNLLKVPAEQRNYEWINRVEAYLKQTERTK